MYYLYKNENNEGWELVASDENREVLQEKKVSMQSYAAGSRFISRTTATVMFKLLDKEMDPALLK